VYNKFFGLTESPFRITPDPRFLYLGPAHREALATLIYGIRERKGIVALTGGVGTGKTTLLEGLFERLASDCVFVRIRDPKADFSAIVRELLGALGLSSSGIDRSDAMKLLWERLSASDATTINPVLVIDEAQDVRDDVLEDFRLLSNLETHDRKLIQMLLVGQPEFRRRLEAPALEPLRQRIALSTTIHPLTLTECTAYVKHRLSVAGAESEGIFAIGAFEAIHDYARGIPRLINVVCDGALSMGYATGTRPIHAGLIREVVQDLRGEGAPIRSSEPGAASARAAGAGATSSPEPAGRRWVAITAAACTLIVAGALGGPAVRRWAAPREPVVAPPPSIAAGAVDRSADLPSGSRMPAGGISPAPQDRRSPQPEPSPEPSSGERSLVPDSPPGQATPLPAPRVADHEDEPPPSDSMVDAAAPDVPEPRFDGVVELRSEEVPPPDAVPAVEIEAGIADDTRETQAALKRERELQRERDREAKAKAAREAKEKAAKEAKEKAARERLAKVKSATRSTASEATIDADVPAEAAEVIHRGTTSVERSPQLAAEPRADGSSRPVPHTEPKMLIVPEPPESGGPPAIAPALKVRELYASHAVGVPEASPRFVPGDTVQLVAVYELSNAPSGGGDVSIDLWVRGPSQEDIPSLGARRVLHGKSGTFQAAVGRRIPANAPSGVYGLVARVSTVGAEARRVFLFRVD
jgi:general secretion pathway protein A